MKSLKSLYTKWGNFFRWLPIILEDYQWDYAKLLHILETKLTLMKEYFETNDIAEDHNDIAAEIEAVLVPLRRYNRAELEESESDLKLVFALLSKNIQRWWD